MKLFSLLKKENFDFLTRIINYTFENYKMPNSTITIIFEIIMKDFDKPYKKILGLFLQNKNYIEEINNIFNKYIINFNDINSFLNENSVNYELLNYLYENKYFESFKSSKYSLATFKKLEIIANVFKNIKYFSYN